MVKPTTWDEILSSLITVELYKLIPDNVCTLYLEVEGIPNMFDMASGLQLSLTRKEQYPHKLRINEDVGWMRAYAKYVAAFFYFGWLYNKDWKNLVCKVSLVEGYPTLNWGTR